MSLATALYSGVSGLENSGNTMAVIGDNVANINTVGFKSSSVTFQDVLSGTIATAGGPAELGGGASLSRITTNFAQGAFESTDCSTDLAVAGSGHFVARDPGSETRYFTRAGQFRFDKVGNFVNPEGYVVQGWEQNDDGNDIGSITDIKLDSFTSAPQATDQITVITNVNADTTVNDDVLWDSWDGSDADGNYIGDNSYAYQTTVKVYDTLGSTHDITIYYDRADETDAYDWEYMATCNPDDDYRTLAAADGAFKGMLARGTITFSENGSINDMTCEKYDEVAEDFDDAETTDGYYTIDNVSFYEGISQNLSLDFGAYLSGTQWSLKASSTTQVSGNSKTTFSSANGYGPGDLQSVTCSTDGTVSGYYSNGKQIPLYRVALAKFQNESELNRRGGNLFMETRESGTPITNAPGTNGLGTIAPNSLEQSNSDLAKEFVLMIITQKGFQANSKIIAITDQMLADLINLKRI